MECPKCGNLKTSTLMEEAFPCCSCAELNVVTYHLCTCGAMWRAVNDVITPESIATFDDVLKPFVEDSDESRVFTSIIEDFQKKTRILAGEAQMTDYIHRCIKCNSVAHETSPNSYKCLTCHTEWEVVAVD
jgi:hypothetical protein